MEEEEEIKITEEELDEIYRYIEFDYDNMTEEELLMWKTFLEKFDPNFYDY